MASSPTPAPPEPPFKADLELLRKEDASLHKQISNVAILRLTLLLVITFLFANGLQHRSDNAVQQILDNINALAKTDAQPVPPLDPITLYLSNPFFGNDSDKFDAMVAQLKTEYSRLLTVKFSAVGTDLSFDLRLIILSFPFWLAINHIYLSILREKRRLIHFIARDVLDCAPHDQIIAMDRLLFDSQEGAYRRYPDLLIERTFWLVAAVLIGLMIQIIHLPSLDGAAVFTEMALALLGLFAFGTLVWTSWMLQQMQRQVEQQTRRTVPADTFSRIWSTIDRWLVALPSRIKPLLTLRTAGLLILFTLVLPTAEVGCGNQSAPSPRFFAISQRPPELGALPNSKTIGESRPGYQLLNGHADWPPSLVILFANINFSENLYGRILYGTTILLALLAILFSVLLRRQPDRYRRLIYLLGTLCAGISLACISEFANPVGLSLVPWLWLLPLALTLVLLLRARWQRRRSPAAAEKTCHAIRLILAPFVIADSIYLVSATRDFPGIVIFYLALHLLTLGYISLRRLPAIASPTQDERPIQQISTA